MFFGTILIRTSMLYRASIIALLALFVGACALTGARGPDGLRVVAKSDYCGTPSQAANLRYFADEDSFGRWLSQRSINDLGAGQAGERGVVVVEMGQRPTGGFRVRLDEDETRIDGDTLQLVMSWDAPRSDAAVSQALVSPCVVLRMPDGSISEIRLLDQHSRLRDRIAIK